MKKNKWFSVVVSTPIISMIIVIVTIILLCFMLFYLKATMYYVVSTELYKISENIYCIELELDTDVENFIDNTITNISAELYIIEDPNDRCEVSLLVDRNANKIHWSGVVNLEEKVVCEENNRVKVNLQMDLGQTELINILKARLTNEN